MEQVGRRSDIRDHHIPFGAHLQKSLHSGTAMFRALSFITMGQQQGNTVHALPFLFAGGNELVAHDLSAIAEIPELSLPQYQSIAVRQSIAIFKSQYTI